METLKIHKELDIIISSAERFLVFGSTVFSTKIKHNMYDHYAFMLVTFCWRQLEHIKSLITLFRADCFQDMQLISRSMIEGIVFLQWANTDKNVALKWRSYAYIEDYRLVLRNLKKNIPLDTKARELIIHGLREYGSMFLRNGTVDNINFKNDPFKYLWHLDDKGKEITISKLFNKTKLSDLFEIYQDMSSWVHWNIRGFGIITKRKDTEINFNYKNDSNAAYSLTAGILAFTHSFTLLNKYLELGFESDLKEIRNDYIEKLNTLKDKNQE